MDKLFKEIPRTGIEIDMYATIEELQEQYKADLQATITSFDDYESIIHETYNDYLAVSKTLAVFHRLGYLFEEEYTEMKSVAYEQRKTVLEGLSRE